MTNKFIYTEGWLKQKAEMEKPHELFSGWYENNQVGRQQFETDHRNYNLYLASLQSYQVADKGQWVEGKEYDRSEFEMFFASCKKGEACDCTHKYARSCNNACFVAYPAPAEGKEDDWKYDYKFLKDLTYKISRQENCEGLSMEEVEAVLLSINYSPVSQPEQGEKVENIIGWLRKRISIQDYEVEYLRLALGMVSASSPVEAVELLQGFVNAYYVLKYDINPELIQRAEKFLNSK